MTDTQTPAMSPIEELAARCEAATEPNEALSMAIVRLDYATPGGIGLGCHYDPDLWMERYGLDPLTSVDAAMMLIPSGFSWTLDGGDPSCCDSAALGPVPAPGQLMNPTIIAGGFSPAMALTAAALRARYSLNLENARGIR